MVRSNKSNKILPCIACIRNRFFVIDQGIEQIVRRPTENVIVFSDGRQLVFRNNAAGNFLNFIYGIHE